jgi:hypothetical protein
MGSQAVYACLAQCLAADPAVQRPAEAQLQQWEGQPGFCTALTARARCGSALQPRPGPRAHGWRSARPAHAALRRRARACA